MAGTIGGLSASVEDQRDLDKPWDGRNGLRENGMICGDSDGGPRRILYFWTSHRTMTAWMGPEAPCVAVQADADECKETGAGGRVACASACGDNISGSGSVSILSHFELSIGAMESILNSVLARQVKKDPWLRHDSGYAGAGTPVFIILNQSTPNPPATLKLSIVL